MIFYDDETWVQPVWLLGKNESMIDWKMGPSTVLCLPLDGPGNHFADERQPEWESVVAYREASLI